jgi:hypothetical protein
MNTSLRERPAAMIRRVAMETGALVGQAQARVVSAAVGVALAPRDAAIEYDHDTRILHPGRTVLILLADAGCRDADVLAAAAFVESVDHELAVAAAERAGALGPGANALLADAPDVPRERLLEELVVTDERVVVMLLAERLDHARHLHLRNDLDWRDFYDEMLDVWLPAAHRFSPGIARRLDRWEESFRRRLFGR